jgi:LuxR family quorum sensing-dependent transcriptional regulator
MDSPVFVLTRRQCQVLSLAARGLTMGCIGRQLGVTGRTVHKHLTAARARLGAMNTTHAVALAIHHQLIQIF